MTDGTQTATLMINAHPMLTDTWNDEPLIDNASSIKTIGATAGASGTTHHFYGYIYNFTVQNNDLWH